jgi:hydrogenase maturation factor
MSKIDAEEAKATLAFLEELGQAYKDELEAFDESWLE